MVINAVRRSKLSDVDRLIIQEEIRGRNIRSILYMAAVALPILAIVILFFYQDLDSHAGVKNTWRNGVISLLFSLVPVFSVSGAIAFYLKHKPKAPNWLLCSLFTGVYVSLPLVGALITSVDQLVTPSINAYFIFCVIPSMVVLVSPVCSFVCYAFGYAVLYFVMPEYQNDLEMLLSNRANGMAATAAGFGLSVIMWRINMIRFRQHRQILAQKQEIETHKAEIEASYEQVSEAYAANQKFFSIISHDLRGPINSTVQLSEVLVNEEASFPKERKEYMLRKLYESLGNTSKLLENLLTWARTQTDSMPYLPVTLNLQKLVLESTEPLHTMAADKGITLRYTISHDMEIYADKEMTCTVVRNLVANAIKFTKEKGTVSIEAEYAFGANQMASFIHLSVIDNGIGMSEKKLHQLFNVGNRVTTLGTHKELGTGLGLILSKEFVEKHGGRISVVSEPKVGSTFRITLPSASAVLV